MTAFAFQREHMPVGIRHLPVDRRGYVVPWFVDRKAPKVDGCPDFRVMDHQRLLEAIREHRCWVCGWVIREQRFAFVAGPMCGINRTSAEPPCHVDCARWSARACPFLSFPKRVRNETDLPDGQMAGVGILRNPGVAMVWICTSFTVFRSGGLLFEIGDPAAVEWVREGRPATRAEVQASIDSGLPYLSDMAAKDRDPDGAQAELDRRVNDFRGWLPA